MLLVEDNPTDVFVIKEILNESGLNLELRLARDGQEAIEFFEGLLSQASPQCPALLLLDLNIPKVTGFEVLQRLRSGSTCGRMPVIILTSSLANADRNAATRLGADAYFQKPVDLIQYARLVEIIREVLNAVSDGGSP